MALRLFKSKIDKDQPKQDNESEKDINKKKTTQRLNSLLENLVKNKSKATELEFAKPLPKRKDKTNLKKITQDENEQKSVKSLETKVVKAVDDVANLIGGDITKTKSELLLKLLNQDKDTKQDLKNIVSGMSVEKSKKSEQKEFSRAEQVRSVLKDKDIKREYKERFNKRHELERVDLSDGKDLGIFSPNDKYVEDIELKTWNKLNERELKLAVTHPPENYFQQMIMWTEQGKIWKFPINNEQEMNDEKDVCFSDHVFLEPLLEPWCPQSGPIRHFMELVYVGLSKNHYLTVKEKRDHIEWYKNYFTDKKQLLLEIGAVAQTDLKKDNEVST